MTVLYVGVRSTSYKLFTQVGLTSNIPGALPWNAIFSVRF